MIYIDFQAGMHGNYLQFVCNRWLAGIESQQPMPFNDLGSAHEWQWLSPPLFECGHFSLKRKPMLPGSRVISITCDVPDLLPIQCVSLLRAGDRGLDPQDLHQDTWHKLDNDDYRWVLHNLVQSFFQDQILRGYQAVADPSWPRIQSADDFDRLPYHIRQECLDQHGLELLRLDADHPHCPPAVLREFFRIGFRHPQEHGFMQQQRRMTVEDTHPIFVWPVASFYDTDQFVSNITRLAQWCALPLPEDLSGMRLLHQAFLDRQIYRDSKLRCDHAVRCALDHVWHDLGSFNVIEQAYIEAELERLTGSTVPRRHEWYRDTLEIMQSLKDHHP